MNQLSHTQNANPTSIAPARESRHFAGMPIVVSPLLPMERSRRMLLPKAWHLKAPGYARRVRKKWRKRFGTEKVEVLVSAGQYFVSSAVFAKLHKDSL